MLDWPLETDFQRQKKLEARLGLPWDHVDPRGYLLLRRNVKRFRGGLVFKAHRLVYHSTLGLRVIKKKKKKKKKLPRPPLGPRRPARVALHPKSDVGHITTFGTYYDPFGTYYDPFSGQSWDILLPFRWEEEAGSASPWTTSTRAGITLNPNLGTH